MASAWLAETPLTKGGYGWSANLYVEVSHSGPTVTVTLWPAERIVSGWVHSSVRYLWYGVEVGGTFKSGVMTWGGDDGSNPFCADNLSEVGGRDSGFYERITNRFTGESLHVTLLFEAGYGPGSATVTSSDRSVGFQAQITGAGSGWADGLVGSSVASVGYEATWLRPQNPEIASVSGSGAESFSVSVDYGDGGTAQYPISQRRFEWSEVSSPALAGTWAGRDENAAAFDTGRMGRGKAYSIRVAAKTEVPVNGDVWARSRTAVVMTSPTDVSGLRVSARGTYGASLSWNASPDAPCYVTEVYEGQVSVTSGDVSKNGAKLLARLAPGVNSWGSDSLWSMTGGLSEKRFCVVRVSSYSAWEDGGKASYATSNKVCDGRYGLPASATLSNGALPPLAPKLVSATNDLGGTSVSNSECLVSWSDAAPTADRRRDGYRIKDSAGNVLAEVRDSEGGQKSARARFASGIAGASERVSVYAFSDGGGETSTPLSAYMYGTPKAPSAKTVSRTPDGMSASFAVPSAVPVKASMAVSWPDGTARYELGVSEPKGGVCSFFGSWSLSSLRMCSNGSVSLLCRPSQADDAKHELPTVCGTLSMSTVPCGEVAVAQRESGNRSWAHVSFEAATFGGDETADSYLVECSTGGKTVEVASVIADGSPSYSVRMGCWELSDGRGTFSVTAMKNGWRSRAKSTAFVYKPPALTPPHIESITPVKGGPRYRFDVVFTPASGGTPFYGPGYRYQVYIDNERTSTQRPPVTQVTVSGETNRLTVDIDSPLWVRVRMTAFDMNGESAPSNAVRQRHEADGVGVFAYGCGDLALNDVSIEGASTCLKVANASRVSLDGAELSCKDGGVYYEVDDELSKVHEVNVDWTVA